MFMWIFMSKVITNPIISRLPLSPAVLANLDQLGYHQMTPIQAASLPLALLLGIKREAVGATFSVGREGNLVIIGEKYGMASPEGRGVLAESRARAARSLPSG